MLNLRHNFLSLRSLADGRALFLERLLFGYAGLALLGVVFLSPLQVAGLTIVSIILFLTAWRPAWILTLWLAYLPLEPFILKWIPDELYVYARYGSEVLLYVVFLSAIIHRLWQPKPLKLAEFPFGPTFIGLVLLVGVSALVNLVDPTEALLGARMIFRFILCYFVVLLLKPSLTWQSLTAKVLAGVVVLQVVLGLSQAVIGAPLDQFLLPSERKTFGAYQLTGGTTQFWDPGERVFGTLGRYDQLGVFLAIASLLLVGALYHLHWSDRQKLWGYGALLFLLLTLTLTYSRSAWFGFLIGFLFIALVIKRDRLVLLGATLFSIAIVTYAGFNGLLVNRLTETGSQTVIERFFESMSAERFRGEYYGLGRVYWMYHSVMTVFPAAPVFGFGPGQYGGGAVAATGQAEVYDRLGLPFGVYGTEGYIDNNWLSLLGELGLVGLGAYLWWYVGLARVMVKTAARSTDGHTKALAAGTAGVFVAVAVNASLATMLEVRTLAPYLWVLAALVVLRAQAENLLD